MPTIFVRNNYQINIVWSSVTEGYDNDQSNYRHLWERSTFNGDWWGNFHHLTSELIHIFDECVFPVFAAYSDCEYLHLIYQQDNEPGLCDENTGNWPCYENFISHMKFYYEWPYYLFLLFYADQTTVHVWDTVNYTNNSYGSPGPITYQWYFEGGTPETSTEKHPSVVYYNEGLFDVTLIGSNDLLADTVVIENYITVLPTINIGDYEKDNNICIYPNPGNGKFILDLSSFESQTVEYSIYDLLGTVVIKESISVEKDFKQTINLTNQAEGIYFINIKTSNDSHTLKMVVQH